MALRILANENVLGEVIDALRRLGHDVVWIRNVVIVNSDNENILWWV